MIERFAVTTTPVVPARRTRALHGHDLVADRHRARLDDYCADTAQTKVLTGIHPASGVDAEALGKLGAAVVGLLSDLDERRPDAKTSTGGRIVERQVEVDDELVAGERPSLSTDSGHSLERT